MNQTMTPTHPLSDPTPVLEWFKSRPANETVGYGACMHICPLAHYLAVQHGDLSATVGSQTYWAGGLVYDQEEWAKLFIYYVDTGFGNSQVTAGDAAYMLESALAELKRRKQYTLHFEYDPQGSLVFSLMKPTPELETKELVPA